MQFKQERSSDQALLTDNTVAQKIAKLFGLSVTDFTKALLKPKIKTGREFTVKSQTKVQVEFSCQALAKAMYERLFKWIVARINKSLDRSLRTGSSFIGILDIAGFEIFKVKKKKKKKRKYVQLFNINDFILLQYLYIICVHACVLYQPLKQDTITLCCSL